MDFERYYREGFRSDITRFFSGIPADKRFHYGSDTPSIQLWMLGTGSGHLDFLANERKAL